MSSSDAVTSTALSLPASVAARGSRLFWRIPPRNIRAEEVFGGHGLLGRSLLPTLHQVCIVHRSQSLHECSRCIQITRAERVACRLTCQPCRDRKRQRWRLVERRAERKQ